MDEKMWPKYGSKIKFKGSGHFWFTNIIKDANDLLEIDREYTIIKLELASSWCGVKLKEFPEKIFALHWFEYQKDLTNDEVRELEGLPKIKKINRPNGNFTPSKLDSTLWAQNPDAE